MHFGQCFVECINHSDGVFILRLLHAQQQCALAVVERQAVNFLGPVGHPGDLLDPHRRAIFTADDDAATVFGALHPCRNLDRAVAVNGADRAGRIVLVFIAHGAYDLIGGDAKGLHRLRVEVDVDLAQAGTHQGHRADPAHILQPLLEGLFGPVGEFNLGHGLAFDAVVGQHGHRPDGAAGGIKTQDLGLLDLSAQQRANGGHFFTHIFGCLAPVDL
ncbi:hypothetical protein GALL_484040 [mine drainage metagenome]|uniref:Uncharacterized protein n=1 Tax=mine drainage metagenome TaxID=410659 RepID=A0A1J5PQY7_9ZZZZ